MGMIDLVLPLLGGGFLFVLIFVLGCYVFNIDEYDNSKELKKTEASRELAVSDFEKDVLKLEEDFKKVPVKVLQAYSVISDFSMEITSTSSSLKIVCVGGKPFGPR